MGRIAEVLASESLALDFQLHHCRKMFSSWDKVRCFLDTMDVSDLPSSSDRFQGMIPIRSIYQLAPKVGSESWLVGEKTIQQILSIVQPTKDSENRRKDIIEYLQRLIGDAFGIKVLPFGSVPLKTYLPHGDVDLTALSQCKSVEDLAADIFSLLEYEEKNNASIEVRDVLCVPAQVRVIKCTVGDIAVDISLNQTAGHCALYFLEQVDQYIGRDHLFKRSVILVKAWCYYESRLLGAFHGLLSTYALETMVLHVINLFHSSLHCPLGVLFKFLEYYSTFDWSSYCIAINGLVLTSALPRVQVVSQHGCDNLLLSDIFLRSSREVLLPFTGVIGTNPPPFTVKHINILDPLRDDNNLGRSVSKGSFCRIKTALSLGAQSLCDILMLPPEMIGAGVEKFFKNTLEKNGKGSRIDVSVPVPIYGLEDSGISAANYEHDDLLTGVLYGLWLDDFDLPNSGYLSTHETHQIWYNGWGGMCYTDQNAFCYVQESPPSSVGSPVGFRQIQATSFENKLKPRGTFSSSPRSVPLPSAYSAEEMWKPDRAVRKPAGEKWKSRANLSLFDSQAGIPVHTAVAAEENRKQKGTHYFVDSPRRFQLDREATVEEKWRSGGAYAYAPPYGRFMQGNLTLEKNRKNWTRNGEKQWREEEIGMELGSVDSQVCTSSESNLSCNVVESSCALNFTMDEFPLLPGSNSIPISTSSRNKECLPIEETSVESTEVENLKPSSPTSLSQSEAGKKTYTDGSAALDSLTGPTVVVEDYDLFESNKTLVLSVEPLQLADVKEFPPLGRQADPVKPVIKLNKKDFPPLSACLKSQKKKKK